MADEEYKIGPEEGGAPEIPSMPLEMEGVSVKPKPKWKKLLVIVILVAAVYVVYTVFSWINDRKKAAAEEQLAAASKKAQVTIPVPKPVITITAQPEPVNNAITDQLSQAQQTLQQKIDELTKQQETNQAALKNLSEDMARNQQNISVLNQNINQVAGSLQQVVMTLQKLTAPKPKPKKAKALKPPIHYTVRAVVPGRAWLEAPDGKTISVRVGDHIEGYGRVQVISPRQGMVITSWGSILQYGVNDE